MKQILTELKRETDSSTIIVEDFNPPFSLMDRTSRQKINKVIENLNNNVNQLDLTDIYNTLYLTTGTCARTDHVLGQKTTLNI